jgi:hypothetical protein
MAVCFADRYNGWAGHVGRMGEIRNAYKILVLQPEGKITLRRPSRRCEDIVRMGLRVTGWKL